jgi:hypothetical protein
MGACLSTPHDVTDGVLSVSGDETVPTKSLEIPTPPPPRVSLILAAKLKLRLGAKAKESRERLRARHEGDVFIDASDSGPVEVAVSNLRIDHTRLVSAGLHSIDAVTLTLYHRRRVGVLNETSVSTKDVRGVATNDAEESKTNTDFESQKKRAQTRWVAIHTTNCYPDNTKNGDLTPLGFRERNGRNLSKHKAPVFFLPDGLSSAPETIRLVVAMSRKTSAKSAQRRMDWRKEDGRGGIDQVAVPRSVTHELATTPSAQTKQLSENVILGESYFSIRDLLVANTRKKQLQLNTSRGAAGFGAVASKSGAVTLCVTPQGISRDWQRSSGVRARTAPGHLSFESLLKRFDESRDFVTNDARGPDRTKQSWAQKKQKNDEAPRVTLRTRGNSIHDSSTRLGRTYVSSGGSGKGIRTRGSGSLRRGDDPGFDDEDDAFGKGDGVARFAGLGGVS